MELLETILLAAIIILATIQSIRIIKLQRDLKRSDKAFRDLAKLHGGEKFVDLVGKEKDLRTNTISGDGNLQIIQKADSVSILKK